MNEQLPIIDWSQHAQAEGGSDEMSRELLALFVQQLPELETRLQEAFNNQNGQELHAVLHRLQGACAYCGLPRLRKVAAEVDQITKQNGQISEQIYQQLGAEVEATKNELARCGINAVASE